MNNIIKKDFVRDYGKKELHSVFKNKDINRQIIGEADIQLFNEDGTLSLEANTQNLINNQAIWNAFYNSFLNRDSLNGSTVLGGNFGKIFLTYTDKLENANLREIDGEVIGHADVRTPYAKDHAYQGTVISEHSITKPGQFKFTVSFGANTANGAFNTVWFGASPLISDSPNNSENGFGYNIRKVESLAGSWDDIRTAKCVGEDGTIYSMTDKTITPFTILEKGTKKELIKGTPFTIANSQNSSIRSAVFCEKTREYFVSYSNSQVGLGIYDELWNEVGTIDLGSFGYNGSKTVMMAGSSKIIVVESLNDSYIVIDAETREFDINSKKSLSLPLNYDLVHVASDWNGQYVFMQINKSGEPNNIEWVCRIQADGTLTPPLSQNETTEITIKSPFPEKYGKYFFISQMDTYLFKSYLEPGSQTRLAGTIVKAQGQTMKITYTFTFSVGEDIPMPPEEPEEPPVEEPTDPPVEPEPEPTPDTTPPEEVGSVSATVTTNTATITWINPTDADFEKVEIYMSESLIYTATKDMATEYVVEGLTPNTVYIATVLTVDATGNKSEGTVIEFTTQQEQQELPDETAVINKATTDVENAEKNKSSYYVSTAQTSIDKIIYHLDIKAQLQARLDVVKTIIAENKYISDARLYISNIPKYTGSLRNTYITKSQEEINKIVMNVTVKAELQAERDLVIAEVTMTQATVDTAQQSINLLPDGTMKTDYQNRLNAIVVV